MNLQDGETMSGILLRSASRFYNLNMTAKPMIETSMEKTACQNRPDGTTMSAPLEVVVLVVLGARVEVSARETPEPVIEAMGTEVAADAVVDTVEDEILPDVDADAPTIVPVPQGMSAPPGCVD